MIEKLQHLVDEFNSLTNQMSDPKIISNIPEYTKITKEHRRLEPIAQKSQKYIDLHDSLNECEEILKSDDSELKQIAKEELVEVKSLIESLTEELKILLLPHDPNDDKNTILEIRSGTGGNEASLFAENLFRMYLRFAESKKWKYDIMSINENEGGGIKEVILSIEGDGAFGQLKYESGVHRVQRIPDTESNGRIHTSAATVAVLP